MSRKYWKDVLFEDGETMAQITRDGLLYRIKKSIVADRLSHMLQGEYGWFFNESRDRYAVEFEGFGHSSEYVTVNPSKMLEWFGYPAIFDWDGG